MLLFYGIGFGLGASIGLVTTEMIAARVFLFQIMFSIFWLRLPKSVHRWRMEENFNIGDFMLTSEDMAVITPMNTGCGTILDLYAPEEVWRLNGIECSA